MSFWFWVGLIVISTLSVPIVAMVEKMKNRQPAPEKEAEWNPEEEPANSSGEAAAPADEEALAPAAQAGEGLEDGGMGFDGGAEFDGFGDDDFK